MPKHSELTDQHDVLPRIFILRGPPGIGKSSVAHKAMSLLDCKKKALIPIDVLQHFDYRGISDDKLKLGVYHTALLCRSFVREKFDVVVEYVFDRHLEFFLEKLFHSHSGKADPCLVFLSYLDAPLEQVLKRNADRENSMPIDILQKLYNEVDATKGMLGEMIINTGDRGMNSKKVAATVLENTMCLSDVGKVMHLKFPQAEK